MSTPAQPQMPFYPPYGYPPLDSATLYSALQQQSMNTGVHDGTNKIIDHLNINNNNNTQEFNATNKNIYDTNSNLSNGVGAINKNIYDTNRNLSQEFTSANRNIYDTNSNLANGLATVNKNI